MTPAERNKMQALLKKKNTVGKLGYDDAMALHALEKKAKAPKKTAKKPVKKADTAPSTTYTEKSLGKHRGKTFKSKKELEREKRLKRRGLIKDSGIPKQKVTTRLVEDKPKKAKNMTVEQAYDKRHGKKKPK